MLRKCLRNKTHNLLCGFRNPLIPMNFHCLLHVVALSPSPSQTVLNSIQSHLWSCSSGPAGHKACWGEQMFAAPKLIWSWKTTGSVGKGRTEGEAKDREVLVALWSGKEETAHSNSHPPQQPFSCAFPHTRPTCWVNLSLHMCLCPGPPGLAASRTRPPFPCSSAA